MVGSILVARRSFGEQLESLGFKIVHLRNPEAVFPVRIPLETQKVFCERALAYCFLLWERKWSAHCWLDQLVPTSDHMGGQVLEV